MMLVSVCLVKGCDMLVFTRARRLLSKCWRTGLAFAMAVTVTTPAYCQEGAPGIAGEWSSETACRELCTLYGKQVGGDTGKTYPSLCIVEEILLGTDIRFRYRDGSDAGLDDENLPSKNAHIWWTIWQDPNGVLNRLRAGVGAGLLADANVIGVPALNISWPLFDHVDALIPGMVNLLPLKGATASRAIMAKPFGCRSNGSDDFEAYMNTALGGIVLPFFIDDWYEYHIWEGEVHCGTAVERDPPTNQAWWGE